MPVRYVTHRCYTDEGYFFSFPTEETSPSIQTPFAIPVQVKEYTVAPVTLTLELQLWIYYAESKETESPKCHEKVPV